MLLGNGLEYFQYREGYDRVAHLPEARSSMRVLQSKESDSSVLFDDARELRDPGCQGFDRPGPVYPVAPIRASCHCESRIAVINPDDNSIKLDPTSTCKRLARPRNPGASAKVDKGPTRNRRYVIQYVSIVCEVTLNSCTIFSVAASPGWPKPRGTWRHPEWNGGLCDKFLVVPSTNFTSWIIVHLLRSERSVESGVLYCT